MNSALLSGLAVVPLVAAVIRAPSDRRTSRLAAVAAPLAATALAWVLLELAWTFDRASVGCFDGVPTCSKGDSIFYFSLVFFGFFYTLEVFAGYAAGELIRARRRRHEGGIPT
jgi:hypothetical protein